MDAFLTLMSNHKMISGSGVSLEEIERAERSLGLRFSRDYKAYLRKFGMIQVDSREFTGIGPAAHLDVVSTTERWRSYDLGYPSDRYVVEVIGVDGMVAWQDVRGSIYLSAVSGESSKVADSLAEYLEKSFAEYGD